MISNGLSCNARSVETKCKTVIHTTDCLDLTMRTGSTNNNNNSDLQRTYNTYVTLWCRWGGEVMTTTMIMIRKPEQL